MTRTAQTRKGRTVPLNTLIPTEGGWFSYVMHQNGFAVLVFVPAR